MRRRAGWPSPILSNIYLDRLDQFVEQSAAARVQPRPPAAAQSGRIRPSSTRSQRAKRHGDRDAVRALRRQRRTLPSQDPNDPDYRRLRYVRYCRRLAARVRRAQARGRGDQVEDRGVPARRTQAGTVAVQDADHARHQPGGALPRLRDQSPTRRHQDHPGSPVGQRRDRSVRAQDRDQAAVRALHEQRETGATRRAAARRGLHHRREVSGRVPRARPVLPSRPGRVPPGPAPLGHGDLACSRPWPGSTAPRSRRWLESTRRRSRHPTDRGRASRSPSNAIEGRKPLVARFGGIPLKRQRTAVLTDQRPVLASTERNELIHRLLAEHCEICATHGRTWRSTTSANSPTSTGPADRRSPPGCTSWPCDDARPS